MKYIVLFKLYTDAHRVKKDWNQMFFFFFISIIVQLMCYSMLYLFFEITCLFKNDYSYPCIPLRNNQMKIVKTIIQSLDSRENWLHLVEISTSTNILSTQRNTLRDSHRIRLRTSFSLEDNARQVDYRRRKWYERGIHALGHFTVRYRR